VSEVLVPDFQGNEAAMEIVMDAAPDVLNHNIETVPRLYRQVRLGARYERSLTMLAYAKQLRPNIPTKSGLMMGLGETNDEVLAVMRDLHAHEVDILTLGQYLRPSQKHLPILRYVPVEGIRGASSRRLTHGLPARGGRSAGTAVRTTRTRPPANAPNYQFV
jgi:lipoic acid synthetase